MKPNQRLTLTVLLALLIAAVVGLVLTRESAPPPSRFRRGQRIRVRDLVDQKPLETARRLALLPAAREERPFARRALKLGDDAVDLAFETALREAAAHPAPPTDEVRGLHQHIKEVQAHIAADQEQIERLERAAKGKNAGEAEDQLELAQAQLSLDQEDSPMPSRT